MIKIDKKKTKKELHGNKKIRVNASLDKDTHDKLKKLAISCDMTKTMLAYEIIKLAVNHVDIIDFFQDRYNQDERYRIIPVRKDGKTYY
ncbi:hypothetical protein [Pallidibacillus thermolactis]|jgi:hypothetical protein|uniref:hypothetical protein n=1 Tax=Pallidibacillus thermolactis TaxID=251051 RepID=UPI00156ACD1B|nr:hypothetical protein [Pallidibacillus thermolactis]MCU9601745.1 hypothetical protein [Pallidibacillus thermolactis subsp. kokeshiiformis]